MAPAGWSTSTLSASFEAGCVGLLAPVGGVITAFGLDWLHLLSIQMPILYTTTGLTLASLSLGAWRHRKPWPVLLGLLGVAGILYPFHEALDVTVFRILLSLRRDRAFALGRCLGFHAEPRRLQCLAIIRR
ncbi:MAG: hypothetical protein ACREQA_09785 [Candidatus Binatia bacterium]